MTMQWAKAPQEVMAAFDAALPADALVQRRKMFGYPCAFVNGNLFAGVYQADIVVRLPEARRGELIAAGAKQFEPMPGRPMREYVVVTPETVNDSAALSARLDEAFRFGASLPVKEAKPRRTKKAQAEPAVPDGRR
jgi:TfoX/Sxy family transcriptional regulator of competence genes